MVAGEFELSNGRRRQVLGAPAAVGVLIGHDSRVRLRHRQLRHLLGRATTRAGGGGADDRLRVGSWQGVPTTSESTTVVRLSSRQAAPATVNRLVAAARGSFEFLLVSCQLVAPGVSRRLGGGLGSLAPIQGPVEEPSTTMMAYRLTASEESDRPRRTPPAASHPTLATSTRGAESLPQVGPRCRLGEASPTITNRHERRILGRATRSGDLAARWVRRRSSGSGSRGR